MTTPTLIELLAEADAYATLHELQPEEGWLDATVPGDASEN